MRIVSILMFIAASMILFDCKRTVMGWDEAQIYTTDNLKQQIHFSADLSIMISFLALISLLHLLF